LPENNTTQILSFHIFEPHIINWEFCFFSCKFPSFFDAKTGLLDSFFCWSTRMFQGQNINRTSFKKKFNISKTFWRFSSTTNKPDQNQKKKNQIIIGKLMSSSFLFGFIIFRAFSDDPIIGIFKNKNINIQNQNREEILKSGGQQI